MIESSSYESPEILHKLPRGWIWTQLGDVAEYVNGRAFKPSDWESSGRPIIRIQNLTSSTDTINRYSQQVDEKFLIRDGDFLISWSATLGAFIYRGEEAVLNQHIFRVRPYVDKLFLFYLVSAYIDSLKKKVHGTGMQHITKGKFEESRIPLPPNPEQIRIVLKIEERFTQLDAGVTSLKKVQTQLKRYRQAVLKAAFEGRLTQEWREGHKDTIEPAEELLDKIVEQQKKQKKKPHENIQTFKNSHKLPNEWIWCSSNDIFEFVTSGSRWWAKYYSDNGALFIRIGNLTRDSISLILDNIQKVSPQDIAEMKRTRVLENDILVSITADIGSIGLVPKGIGEAYINQHIALCRPVKQMNPKFIAWFFRSETGGNQQLIKFQRGATKKGLGLDDIKSVDVPLCSLIEQDLVVLEIERHFSQIDHIEKAITTSLRQAESLRQSILKQAFEGRLVPQDPSDEPASVLLERIKAEKALHQTKEKSPKTSKRKIKNAR